MALVTWCALLPQVVALSLVLPNSLPFLVAVAVSTAVPVCLLTWLVMPALTRALHGWLYPSRESDEQDFGS
jgi:antibiotic biosynthesis monooxygenase (ABM) superfamily enzyme